MVVITGQANAAETTVNGRLYAEWLMNTSETTVGYDEQISGIPPETTLVPRTVDGFNQFNITRAYVTVKSKLSERTSVRITSDIKESNGLYNIMLKYGYLDWLPGFGNERLKVRFGLQPTQYIDEMNGVWGRRYLIKTIGDLSSFLTSSDLGASAIFSLGADKKLGNFSITVFNGTKYSDTREANKNKDLNFFGIINPLKNSNNLKNSVLLAQAYIGTQNEDVSAAGVTASDWKRKLISVGGALVYKSLFDLGFDINNLTLGDGPGNDDLKRSGMSFFGTIYLADLSPNSTALRTLNLFARVDLLDPDTETDKDANTTFITGLECTPVKGFKASVNYRNTSFEADGVDAEGALYLSTLVKF